MNRAVTALAHESARHADIDGISGVDCWHFRLGSLLSEASRLRRAAFDHRLRRYGITFTQWSALNHVADASNGMIQSELARRLELGKVAIGNLLERMIAGDLVARDGHHRDRRSKRIRITNKGSGLLDEIENVAERVNHRVMDGVTQEEEQILVAALCKMKANLKVLLIAPAYAVGDDIRRVPAQSTKNGSPAASWTRPRTAFTR